MPRIKSAQKKQRQDKKKRVGNEAYKAGYKKAVKKYLLKPSKSVLSGVFSLIDKASKKRVIHKNKAARLKSRLAKKSSRKNG